MTQRMWMVKTEHLAPYWGIAYTRKALIEQLAARGLSPSNQRHRQLTFVRVRVEEEVEEELPCQQLNRN